MTIDDTIYELIQKENKLAMEDLIRQHDQKKAEEQDKLIESFKKQLKILQKPKSQFSKKMMDNCFEKCREFAMSVVLECTLMSKEDIACAFSSKDKMIVTDMDNGIDYPIYNSYYWFNNIKRDQNNIPFPSGMEIPKRRDQKTGNLVDINFSVSKFYSDSVFINKCNEYYNNFNLKLSIQKDLSNPKYRNNWKLILTVIQGNYIVFDKEKFRSYNDQTKMSNDQEYGDQTKMSNDQEYDDENLSRTCIADISFVQSFTE
jgi:hypothetical protein